MCELWTLGILFSVLQTGVWSDDAFSVTCNGTFQVQVGESVTIKCAIATEKKCYVTKYKFASNNVDMCNNTLTGNVCKSDDLTHISLNIKEVLKVEKIDVEVSSKCGMSNSSVTVQPYGERQTPLPPQQIETKTKEESQSETIPIVSVAAVLIVIVIVPCVVYRKSINNNIVKLCPNIGPLCV